MVDVDVHMSKNLADMRIVIEVKDIGQLSRSWHASKMCPTCWKPSVSEGADGGSLICHSSIQI